MNMIIKSPGAQIMKKLFVSIVIGMLGVTAAIAQTEKLSDDELKFRNGIQQFLQKEGYVPTVDNRDNSLNWKKEGSSYWLHVHGSSPTYIELHKEGFTIDDCNHDYLLMACNKASNEIRCAKVYVTKNSVWLSIELFCSSVEEFSFVFNRSVSALDAMRVMVKKYYNEYEDEAEQNVVVPRQQQIKPQIQQQTSSRNEKVYDVVEQMPRFPENLSAWLARNIQYPPVAQENGIQGRVVVQFIIEKDGSISGAEVIKKVNEHLDAEALRVIGEMPKWTPGKQKGEAVRVKFTLPVTFRLS
jgi:TonB family protein